ncbi:MAG: hypothetical protein IJZ90_02765 [Clostridia bacterium]|nr:hypothetical protein [Clostridia bacterium]
MSKIKFVRIKKSMFVFITAAAVLLLCACGAEKTENDTSGVQNTNMLTETNSAPVETDDNSETDIVNTHSLAPSSDADTNDSDSGADEIDEITIPDESENNAESLETAQPENGADGDDNSQNETGESGNESSETEETAGNNTAESATPVVTPDVGDYYRDSSMSFFSGSWQSNSGVIYVFNSDSETVVRKDGTSGEVISSGTYDADTEDFSEYTLSVTFDGVTEEYIAWLYSDTGSVVLIDADTMERVDNIWRSAE